MNLKKDLDKYKLISSRKKEFQVNFSNDIRLKFKIGKRESFQPANYLGKKSVDLYFFDSSLKNIKKWYILDVQNDQFFLKKEISGFIHHISLHDLKGSSSQIEAGQRRLCNFHFSDEKKLIHKIEISGNPNNFNDMGIFHIIRSGKKYGLPYKHTLVEQIHIVQNFDPVRLSVSTFNKVFDALGDLDKELFRKYFYSFKTKIEIKEFEALFGTQTFWDAINKFDEKFKILEITDTRYSILLHFEKLYDPNTAYFEVKNKMIKAQICNNKTNGFCILGHLEALPKI